MKNILKFLELIEACDSFLRLTRIFCFPRKWKYIIDGEEKSSPFRVIVCINTFFFFCQISIITDFLYYMLIQTNDKCCKKLNTTSANLKKKVFSDNTYSDSTSFGITCTLISDECVSLLNTC